MTISLPTPEQIGGLRALVESLSYKDADEEIEVDLAEMKSVLRAFGVNQRGWRLLLDYRDTLLGPVRECLFDDRAPLASLERLGRYLQMLQECEMDVIPPDAFVHAWLGMRLPGIVTPLSVPTGLFRCAWKECVLRQNDDDWRKAFLSREMPAVAAWFVDTDHDFFLGDSVYRHGWGRLYETYIEWKTRCTHTWANDRDWEPLLAGKASAGNYDAVELVSARAIEEEGEVMRHCVANYIPDCREGRYRVFSLRNFLTDERLATLGLSRVDGFWTIDDLRMQDDEEADNDLREAAQEVEELCRQAALARCQDSKGGAVQQLVFLFKAAMQDGDVAFADIAPRIMSRTMRHMGRRGPLRLQDLRAAYIAAIVDHVDDPESEIVEALMVSSIEEIILASRDEGQAALFDDVPAEQWELKRA